MILLCLVWLLVFGGIQIDSQEKVNYLESLDIPEPETPNQSMSRKLFEEALKAEGITGKAADLAWSIYAQESGLGTNTKTSNRGAVGGMQVTPIAFKDVADKGWDITDPMHNARAGIRYLKKMYDKAGGDPALAASGYYGGPSGLEKARMGVAVSDPKNPQAPNTLEYGQKVVSRMAGWGGSPATQAMPPAQAAGAPARTGGWVAQTLPIPEVVMADGGGPVPVAQAPVQEARSPIQGGVALPPSLVSYLASRNKPYQPPAEVTGPNPWTAFLSAIGAGGGKAAGVQPSPEISAQMGAIGAAAAMRAPSLGAIAAPSGRVDFTPFGSIEAHPQRKGGVR